MVYNWDAMVAVKVPVGLNGWQNRGMVIINGRKFLFPVGVETMMPEPVAFYIDLMIRLEEESNRPPSAPPENEDDECDCVVSIIESASPTKADLGSFSVLGPVRLPNAESIGDSAFNNCPSLTSIDLPAATSIGNSAFWSCDSLTSIDLPVATSIGGGAFLSCPSLTSIDLPMATSIESNAFNGCTSLTSIDLPAATSIGDSAFNNCSSLTSIDLPAATSIGNSAFWACTSLTSIDLPVATSIGGGAFHYCPSLTSIDLPAVTSIGGGAFEDCTKLTALILRTTETVCVVDVTALNNTPLLTGEGHVYVPAAMYEYYRAGYEEVLNASFPGFFDILFRKLEDYTVDGTATGKLDENKM